MHEPQKHDHSIGIINKESAKESGGSDIGHSNGTEAIEVERTRSVEPIEPTSRERSAPDSSVFQQERAPFFASSASAVASAASGTAYKLYMMSMWISQITQSKKN